MAKSRLEPIEIPQPGGLRPARDVFARASGAMFDVRDDTAPAIIELYTHIGEGDGGVTASDFRATLLRHPGDIVLRVNSPGGDVFAAAAMLNDLLAHNGSVRVEIVGIAASAASVLAMAGDRIAMAKNAHQMIHRSWGLTIGNTEDHREQAAVLDKVDRSLAKTYARRTKMAESKVAALMRAETWMDADEAVRLGFADEVMASERPRAAFDLSMFQNVPPDLQAALPDDSKPLETRAELESLLRRAGLSRAAAKAVAARGWQGLTKDDPALDALAQRIEAATNKWSEHDGY